MCGLLKFQFFSRFIHFCLKVPDHIVQIQFIRLIGFEFLIYGRFDPIGIHVGHGVIKGIDLFIDGGRCNAVGLVIHLLDLSAAAGFSQGLFGLLLSGNPLSLYTLYGVIALTGIAVNSAIVLIDAANERRAVGMSVQHAIIYAARRRVVPILITSTTPIGGLFSLAVGLGGKSLMWGPVAASIVWGLGFSTVLTLFAIPLVYRLALQRRT